MDSVLGKFFSGWYRRNIHLPRTDRVARSLSSLLQRLDSVESLLDVGAGDGRIAVQVAEAVGIPRVAGVDILLRPESLIPVELYDGDTLPFEDDSFEVAIISDVLHHAENADRLLSECMRVTTRGVAIKDHIQIGTVSDRLLLLMDVVGNAPSGVVVRGNYWNPREWFDMVDRVGGRVAAIDWPVQIHDLPWRVVTRSELQFSALIEHKEVPSSR